MFLFVPFSRTEKSMNFRLQNLPTTTGGARILGLEPTRVMSKSLLEEKVPQILRKLDFHQKNGGDFLMGFLRG